MATSKSKSTAKKTTTKKTTKPAAKKTTTAKKTVSKPAVRRVEKVEEKTIYNTNVSILLAMAVESLILLLGYLIIMSVA